jgi:hypothetical protein
MKLKVYFDDVEIELPLYREENALDIELDLLNKKFKPLIDNIKVFEYFGIKLKNGKQRTD